MFDQIEGLGVLQIPKLYFVYMFVSLLLFLQFQFLGQLLKLMILHLFHLLATHRTLHLLLVEPGQFFLVVLSLPPHLLVLFGHLGRNLLELLFESAFLLGQLRFHAMLALPTHGVVVARLLFQPGLEDVGGTGGVVDAVLGSCWGTVMRSCSWTCWRSSSCMVLWACCF